MLGAPSIPTTVLLVAQTHLTAALVQDLNLSGSCIVATALLQKPLPSLRSLDLSHTSLGGTRRGTLRRKYLNLPGSCLTLVSGLTRLQLGHTKG